MALLQRYKQALADGHRADPHQARAVARLADLQARCDAAEPARGGWFRRPPPLVRGIYLWGGVGRGKTWLMDMYFETLPGKARQRLHFHRFMQDIHHRLRGHQRRANPLERVARELASNTRVLCLDEFVVTDIGDAVIIAGLLRALFDAGVVLVTTSNQPPDNLYRGGIQRASFLPAIALLNQHTEVIELGGDFDYRRQVAERSGTYHWPLDDAAEAHLTEGYAALADGAPLADAWVDILGRRIPCRGTAHGVAWFDFDALCGPPRSQNDYIELARQHHSVVISDIPLLDGSSDDRARRFIMLIDEFYDRRVKLMISAATTIEQLYCGERLAFEFQRTASRLAEMQTAEYLSQPHRP